MEAEAGMGRRRGRRRRREEEEEEDLEGLFWDVELVLPARRENVRMLVSCVCGGMAWASRRRGGPMHWAPLGPKITA